MITNSRVNFSLICCVHERMPQLSNEIKFGKMKRTALFTNTVVRKKPKILQRREMIVGVGGL